MSFSRIVLPPKPLKIKRYTEYKDSEDIIHSDFFLIIIITSLLSDYLVFILSSVSPLSYCVYPGYNGVFFLPLKCAVSVLIIITLTNFI